MQSFYDPLEETKILFKMLFDSCTTMCIELVNIISRHNFAMSITKLNFKSYTYLYKISSFCGIVPIYSFDEKNFSDWKKKIVKLLVFVIQGIVFGGFIHMEILCALNESIKIVNFIQMLLHLTFCQLPMMCIIISHGLSQKWEHYLAILMHIKEKLLKNDRGNYKDSYYLSFLISIGLQLILILINWNDVQIQYLFDLNIINNSIKLVGRMNWLLINSNCIFMILLFRRMYQLLKIQLRRDIEEAHIGILICDEEKTVQQIKIIKKLHMNLFEEIALFNTLFGWYMLSIMFHHFLANIYIFAIFLERRNDVTHFTWIFTEVRFRIHFMFI